jgi:hypothetical protein
MISYGLWSSDDWKEVSDAVNEMTKIAISSTLKKRGWSRTDDDIKMIHSLFIFRTPTHCCLSCTVGVCKRIDSSESIVYLNNSRDAMIAVYVWVMISIVS